MRKTILSLFGAWAFVLCALAQDTSPGNNTSQPVSSESQTISPVGQTDFQTDPFTGRFGYAFPLDVAPARHNSEPNLEVLYNSANANGWCGLGWDVDLGYIERESKYGVPVQWSNGKPILAYDDTKGFLFSFKNKISDLVNVSGGSWRAQVQSDFLQFNYYSSTNTWIVIDKSGNQYFFGSSSASRMTNPKWSTSGDANTWHWALDTIITATGDKTTISYTSAGGRLYPHVYSYNGSTGGSGITPPCVVTFNLTATNRPDTTISCRAAYAVTNQYLLSSIVHTVSGQMVWSNYLQYSFSPSTGRALLYTITHYGSDQSHTLPPITFGYSQQNFTFQTAKTWTNLYRPGTGDTQSYYSLNCAYVDLVDMDGDGLPDRVIGPYTTPSTTWWVQHNTGAGFANPTTWTVANQVDGGYNTENDPTWAQVQGTHGCIIDLNGDGWPDFAVDPIGSYLGGSYANFVVQLNNSTNILGTNSWTNVNALTGSSDYRAVQNGTYSAMLDMNGDGLPDRVLVSPTSPYTNYLVQFNTGHGFTTTNIFGPYAAQGATSDLDWAGLIGYAGSTGNLVSMRMLDINGDGLPDRVMLIGGQNGSLNKQFQTNLVVELNNGYGFEPAIKWTNVNPYFNVECPGGTQYSVGAGDLGDDAYVTYRDVNGDGLPDRILALQCSPYTEWLVQLNTGTGFGTIFSWATGSQGQTSNTNYCGINTTTITQAGISAGVAMLLDMNGDGLPDRVEYQYPGPSSDYVVELSTGPYPDLLIAASNGLGGIVTATYQPSTKIDNRESTTTSPTRYLLPFLYYAVSSVSVYDGINPASTTSYSYTGGYWNNILRQFDGFAQTTVADPLQMTNIHWFHQAGGRNNSSSGEYLDSTNAIGKVGMEYRTDIIGSDGNYYKTVLNQVNEYSNNLQHFAYISTNLEIDYPATTSSYKARATVYYFNLGNGNLTNQTDWGQVIVSLPPANETFTDTGSDTCYRIIQYANLTNPNIIDKPQQITLYDHTGVDVLRQLNFSYDQNTGNVLQELGLICLAPDYRSNTYTYDSYNNTHTATDAAGVLTQYTYDSTSQTFPVQITEGGSYTTSSTFDPRSGKIYKATNEAGWVISNQYDVFLRLAVKYCSTTQNGSPGNWLDQYTYALGDSSGPQNSVLHQESDGVDLSNGHETMTWFDGLGRPIQSRVEAENGQYRVSDTAYDARGNVEFVSLPYFASGTARSAASTGLGTLHGYDHVGRLSQLTDSVTGTFTSGVLTGTSPTGGDSSSPIGTASIAYYYSTTGDPWTWVVTDEAGTVHRYTRDAYGRTNQVVEVNGSQTYTTTLGWNLASDLLSITDNAANVIQYSNNLMGEVVAVADPDRGVWLYTRDYAGRVRAQIDGNNQRITNNYSPDPLGRLLSRQVYDLKGNFYYGITNIYDANTGDTSFPVYLGQLYKTIDSEGFAEYGYDVRGRKTIARRYLAKNGNYYTNQFAYDDMDRVRYIVYPNGGPTITNAYDNGANLSVVQLAGGGTKYYQATTFTPLDQPSAMSYGTGASAAYSYYSNSKRFESVVIEGLQNLSYTYDAVANVASITDNGGYSGSASAGISSAVSYDSLHRLLGFTRASGATVSCTYDTVGNMLTDSENGSASYVYSTPSGTHLPHAVKSANGLTYAYDLCGNMLARGNEALMYNPENRLIALAVNNQATTFGYDADGNRLWKQGPTNSLQVWIDRNYEEKDGKILYHIWADKRIVYTYSSDGGVTEYYIPDHLHSAEYTANSSGLKQHYEYTAYGNIRYTLTTNAFSVTRRYTSQSFDEETGLYYYGNSRYYDPVIGRFVQPDTVIPDLYDPQTYNCYAYARDNPLRYVDPSGHSIEDYFLGMSGLASFVASSSADNWAKTIRHQNGSDPKFKNFADAQDYVDLIRDPTGTRNADVRLRHDEQAAISTTQSAAGGMTKTYLNVEAAIVAPEVRAATETLVTSAAASETATKAMAPLVGGGAKLEYLTTEQIARIQAVADKRGLQITVVGSRARGTADAASDWDYIIKGANARSRHSALYELPKNPQATKGGDFRPGSEALTGVSVDPEKPHISFIPNPNSGN